MEYRVMLDEGHSCMGGDESACESRFSTYEEAAERCRVLVRLSLESLSSQGFAGSSLLAAYEARGVQPFILPASDPVFDALAFAREFVGRM